MNNRFRWTFATLAFAALAAFPVIAGQISTQRPPRVTTNSVIKPTATPGKFKTATLPMTLTPEKPVNESGALMGYASFDLSEGKISVRSGDFDTYVGQYVGINVMLAKPNRPVTFEFDLHGADKADKKIRLVIHEKVRKPDGKIESKMVNMTVVALIYTMRQRISITGNISGEGWVTATATPVESGTNFDLMSITVRQ